MKSSPSRFYQVTGSRWFAVILLLLAALLLGMVAMTFKDNPVALPALDEEPLPVDRLVPVQRIEQLSSNLTDRPSLGLVNGGHPFVTTYFKAATPPPEPETPPATVLKKVPLLYQGLYRTADGREQAFLKVNGKLSVLPAGAPVLNDWSIATLTPQKLTLTNRSSEPTILEFNREKILEVPAE